MGIGENLTDNMINLVVVGILAVSLIPLAVTAILNISTIANNPVPALFAAGGVIIVLIFIGLFRGVLGLTKLRK